MYVTMSTFYGRCYTIESQKSKIQVYLRNKTDIDVTVHKCGEEFWILVPTPPTATYFMKIPVFFLGFSRKILHKVMIR